MRSLFLMLLLPSSSSAALVFGYTGGDFLPGPSEPGDVRIMGSLDGWVQFATPPELGELGKTDVVRWQFGDGSTTTVPITLDGVLPVSDELDVDMSFDFSGGLPVAWDIEIERLVGVFRQRIVSSEGGDSAEWISTVNSEHAFGSGPSGAWVTLAGTPPDFIPEPSAAIIWLVLGLITWRRVRTTSRHPGNSSRFLSVSS